MKYSHLYFYYSIIIYTLCYSCSSSYEQQGYKDYYKIYVPEEHYFIGYDILTAEDNKGNDFYVLTKYQKDSTLLSLGYEKMKYFSKYKLELKKIDSIVVLKTFPRNFGKIYQNEIIIWSQDTVRVPLYYTNNIARSWNDVYVKK